jgi:polar amino acid transport system substrate-binding protein
MTLLARSMAVVAALVAFGCTSMDAPPPGVKSALAPTGKVRLGFVSTSIYATKDGPTGELKGVAIDIGDDLARRLAVPLEPRVFPNVTALLAAAQSGDVDVVLMGINAERAKTVDFSAPYMEVELGYLVPAGSAITRLADVDRAGVRVGVLEKGGSDLALSTSLKNAQLVRATSAASLYEWLSSGKVDAVASTKTSLFVEADRLRGSRVLDGHFLVEPIGAGVPKGRGAAAVAFTGDFVETEKSSGRVKAAIDRAGLRGVVVASPR